jgi:hypothetical protein
MTTSPRSTPTSTALFWLVNLATRMLANSLNMPAPLVYDTGVFVYARVQAAEHRAAKTLRLHRLLRRLKARLRLG